VGLSNIDEWRSFCAEASKSRQPSPDNMWRESDIKPPPVEDATCSIPLAQAARYAKKARDAKHQANKVQHLDSALEWLDCPHPEAFPSTLHEMGRLKIALEQQLQALEHGK
jgi:hypothetical protein